MSRLTCELTAVNKLSFVADAYPYGNDGTIVVVLKPALRESLPLDRSVFRFTAETFTAKAVVETYEREVVYFLARSLRTAEQFLGKSVTCSVRPVAHHCLN